MLQDNSLHLKLQYTFFNDTDLDVDTLGNRKSTE